MRACGRVRVSRFITLLLYIDLSVFQKGPLRLYYSVYTNPAKRFKAEVEEPMILETDTANNSDLKTEVSGYYTDEEKHNNEELMTQDTDESKTDSVLDGDGIDIDNEGGVDNIIKEDHKSESVKESVPEEVDVDKGSKDKHGESVIKDRVEVHIEDQQNDSTNNVDSANISADDLSSNVKDEEADKELSSSELFDKVLKEHASISSKGKTEQDSEIVDDKKEKQEVDSRKSKEDSTKVDTQTETNNMVEASTDTVPCTSEDVQTSSTQVLKKSKSCLTDEDVSEPVVSSTQNTQGCQTEPPETGCDNLDIPHSSESDNSAVSPSHKSTVDVSCETDNFVVHRLSVRESVSVSTDTDDDGHVTKRKSVECSTDVYDFPGTDVEVESKGKVDCSTDLSELPFEPSKRNALSVDCPTDMDDIILSSNKRKSLDADQCNSDAKVKKTDPKVPKRSFSYTGHLSTPKTAYLAQPLSPTKITLKFTQPKSPLKTCPKSPSRSETSGFQSQYQSFVMELPEKTYRFEDDEPAPSKTLKRSNSVKNAPSGDASTLSLSTLHKKSVSKTGRPRGRPPKNRSHDCSIISTKEKKHKSRSHSPKHRKNSEKDRDRSSEGHSSDRASKSAKPLNQDTPKKSNAYSWINKLDTNHKSLQPSEQKHQKAKEETQSKVEKPPSDLRIPKQFLYYSNGQYTLASVSSLSTLKQSSPVSPPPRTVFTAEVNKKDKSDRSKADLSDYKIPKTTKPLKSEEKTKNSKQNECAEKTYEQRESKPEKGNTNEEVRKSQPCAQIETKTQVSVKTDANQNKIVKTTKSISPSPLPKIPKYSLAVQSVPSTHPTQTKEKSTTLQTKDKPPVTSTSPLPEYRHQSPFFASMSAAKLSNPHRPTTHLNIPNLSRHFSGTHPLYAHGNYSNERLGPPLYRSFSVGEKPSTQTASKFEEQRRIDEINYMNSLAGQYFGLVPRNYLSSLPHPHLTPSGPYKESSKSLSYSDHATNGASSMSHNSNKAFAKPTNTSTKGKEKSIDKIINQITEMRTKKETQEQINGIDLSTKGVRKEENGEKSPPAAKQPQKQEVSSEKEVVKIVNNGRVESGDN